MEVLVTGGSGFIGRNIVKVLESKGYSVTVFDIKEDADIRGDVRDKDAVLKACRGKDYVFHLAAVTSPPEFENLMGDGFGVNVLGTYNVLAASAVMGVKRVVLASSSAVYGSQAKPSREDEIPESYSNFYPASKRFNEMTASVFRSYNLETISLRYFNTYGPGENEKGLYSSVIWKFISDIRGGRKPVIYGDGTQRRDFIYVEDVAFASVLALERGKPWEIYNVGTGVSTDFNTIFKIVKEEMNYEGQAVYVPNPLKSYQKFTQADMTKARRDLGFEPRYDIRKGVRRILETFS